MASWHRYHRRLLGIHRKLRKGGTFTWGEGLVIHNEVMEALKFLRSEYGWQIPKPCIRWGTRMMYD